MDEHVIEGLGKARIVVRDGKVAEVGEPLAQAAGLAFTDSFGLAILLGSAVTLIGALLVAIYLPPEHLETAPSDEDESLVAADSSQGPAPAHAQR